MTRIGIAIVAGVARALLAAPVLGDDLHASFDALLKRAVDGDGRVAYRTLQQRDSAALDAYLASLAAADPASLTESEQIAFWINAYNARVLRGVLDGYSAEGLLGRKRFFSFYSFPLAGRSRTLDEIEHEILRRQFREPRIHFALVCASTSCPTLRSEAYRGDRLDAQLDEQARAFVNDPRRNQFGPGDTIKLSSIFKWFGDDFAAAAGSVPAFLRRYHPVPEPVRIEYLDYDWTLNAQPGQRPS
jgi:hypothetical protein